MKKLQKLSAATMLTLVLACSTLAGDISIGRAAAGDISIGRAAAGDISIGRSAAGDSSGGLMETVLGWLELWELF